MMDLNEAREAIDAVDGEMARLFVRRMEAVREIAAYKLAHGLPTEDRERERLMEERLCALIDDAGLRPFYLRFLENTVELSKSYQRGLMPAAGDSGGETAVEK
ncbi:MAG: chorismate mutase [Oscillospiraceae bacterium]|nr:chorismate mutase [Oscillospiraceae bacterium]